MINVVNKKTHKTTKNDFYIGRPSILGNPYTHLKSNTIAKFQVPTREDAIHQYELWLIDKIIHQDPKIIAEIKKIIKLAKEGDVNLVCWCAPKSCHGDVIKKIIEKYFTLQEV